MLWPYCWCDNWPWSYPLHGLWVCDFFSCPCLIHLFFPLFIVVCLYCNRSLWVGILQEEHKGTRVWRDVLCSAYSQVSSFSFCPSLVPFYCCECFNNCLYVIYSSVVVSAGILRIFGQDMAELPLVATRKSFQEKVTLKLFVMVSVDFFLYSGNGMHCNLKHTVNLL